ncbi:dTMP kinase [Salinispora arenicola]|uniref:dTMP kinase n=1 Tax=Salinispora arenicola TaxID=168697 RepID=UPI0003A7FDD4
MLIVIEGPNGVGKTTVARLLAERLRHRADQSVHLTTEPTRTRLGELLREAEAIIHGRALALAIAADRTMHVEDEIIPTLDAGNIVISDRYVQSSLVLQRVDAVDLREIWSYIRYVLQPAISIYLRLSSAGCGLRSPTTGGVPAGHIQLFRHAWREC